MATAATPPLVIRPLTPERWPDLEAVFGARGCSVARRCWCMYYRLSGGDAFGSMQGGEHAQSRKTQLQSLVEARRPPGLVGYRATDFAPVGWVSLGPRADFARLVRSPVMKAIDDRPVWSIVCFVVPSPLRGQGVARALLDGAVEYARLQGATVLEAYPVDRVEPSNAESMWFGAKTMYDQAGFREVARRKPERPVVRLELGATQG